MEIAAGRARISQFQRLAVVEGWVNDGFVTLDITRPTVKATVVGVEYEEPRKEFPSEEFIANAFLLIGAGAENRTKPSDHLYTWKDYR